MKGRIFFVSAKNASRGHDSSGGGGGGGVCARSGRRNRTAYRNGLPFSSSHTFATSSVARAVASRQPAPLAPLSPIRNIPCLLVLIVFVFFF